MVVTYQPIEKQHLEGVSRLCQIEGWKSYSVDPSLLWQAFTAPGVHTLVATDKDLVVGFVQMITDGAIQSFIPAIIVHREYRRMGIGRSLIEKAFARTGSQRVDLLADPDVFSFYRSFKNQEIAAFRIYPNLEKNTE